MARIDAKLCQNAFQTIPDVSFFDAKKNLSAKILDRKFCFLPFWRDFGGATNFWTSKSASSSNFALDRIIQRSVRPKNIRFGKNLGSSKKFYQVKGVRFPAEVNRQPHIIHLFFSCLRQRPKKNICRKFCSADLLFFVCPSVRPTFSRASI